MKYNFRLNDFIISSFLLCVLLYKHLIYNHLKCNKNFKFSADNFKKRGFIGNSSGFTLIEIMVVMILIAIAGSIVLINVGQSGRMKESRLFSEKIVSMCRKARASSMSKGVPACFAISSESRKCQIRSIDDLYSENSNNDSIYSNNDSFNSSSPPSSSELTIPENMLLEGENIKSDDNGLYFICFYPDGSSTGGILTVSMGSEFEFTFQVDMLTGSIREIDDSDS